MDWTDVRAVVARLVLTIESRPQPLTEVATALRRCLELVGQNSRLDQLHDFAARHEYSDREELAGHALMRFLVGKCDHDFIDSHRKCELCGVEA